MKWIAVVLLLLLVVVSLDDIKQRALRRSVQHELVQMLPGSHTP